MGQENRYHHGYCAQCHCYCPTVNIVRDGVFIGVRPDDSHPNTCTLCPKGLAGPELVYNKQRLQYPMRRTNPKGNPDPGWERITWDEALNTAAIRLNEIKNKSGPEAVVFATGGPGGSPVSETLPWIRRLAHAFGSPNFSAPTHICNWHKDFCSAYTYGKSYLPQQVLPDFENAACILIWGVNPDASRYAQLRDIRKGLGRGAKLIVIDPRRIPLADIADLWLQIQPGTDGALALSMIEIMIREDLYDYEFVRDWTNAPFLVRNDTGNLLTARDLEQEGDPSSFVIVDFTNQTPIKYLAGTKVRAKPALDTTIVLKLGDGRDVECKTVFRLLREYVQGYSVVKAERITLISKDKIAKAARMFATTKPACWYSYNGLEQNTNVSQTNRAISILYALTGNYDTQGGNILFPAPSLNRVDGTDFLGSQQAKKRLGLKEYPLGPPGTSGRVPAYEVYKAILTCEPYCVKALVSFGTDMIISNPSTMVAREAISKLDFHIECELFLTPTAELADIVLPASSFWEGMSVRANFRSPRATTHVQLREAVVSPQHKSWPDMKIIFELAKNLGLGDKFWGGDMEAAFNYMLRPSNITVDQLRQNPGGVSVDIPLEYKKYMKEDEHGKLLGFDTFSKRIEFYSQTFKDHGYEPLPTWERPIALTHLSDKYPLILISEKLLNYCHGQHRAIPSLRKAVPHPFVEINPTNAESLSIIHGEWVVLETSYGNIIVQAKITDIVPQGIVCTQHGWWQACQELNLPGYDPYSSKGANVNLLYSNDDKDPISGSLPIKGYPCNVKRILEAP